MKCNPGPRPEPSVAAGTHAETPKKRSNQNQDAGRSNREDLVCLEKRSFM